MQALSTCKDIEYADDEDWRHLSLYQAHPQGEQAPDQDDKTGDRARDGEVLHTDVAVGAGQRRRRQERLSSSIQS